VSHFSTGVSTGRGNIYYLYFQDVMENSFVRSAGTATQGDVVYGPDDQKENHWGFSALRKRFPESL
jgi:hypothetical protein